MIRQSATSNPATLGLQVDSLMTQLSQLLGWFEDGSLTFEELTKAYSRRQPDIEALVKAVLPFIPDTDPGMQELVSSEDLRKIYSDDLSMASEPLLENVAAAQLSLVIRRLHQLAKYLPRR